MDILITLITEMVTRMCAHAQTQETVYITMYRFFCVYKLYLSKAEKTISLRPLHSAL